MSLSWGGPTLRHALWNVPERPERIKLQLSTEVNPLLALQGIVSLFLSFSNFLLELSELAFQINYMPSNAIPGLGIVQQGLCSGQPSFSCYDMSLLYEGLQL